MRKRRGQILLLSVLGIIVMMLSVSALLVKTSILPLNLSQLKYRETATQLFFGSSAAISKGLADASNNLNRKAASSNYQNYTSLTELTDQENLGLDLLDDWQRDIIKNNPASGARVNFSVPLFECEWHDPINRKGYSSAESNISVSLSNMGFEGLKDKVQILFESTIIELIESDGRETTFKIQFMKEDNEPVTTMPRSLVNVLSEIYYRDQDYKTFNKTETGAVRNIGNGTYLVTYLSGTNNITDNLNLLRDNITAIPSGSLLSYKAVCTNTTGGWHHLSAIKDTNSLKLYVDGVLKDSENVTDYGSISTNQKLILGPSMGDMDEVRFSKAAKSANWLNGNIANIENSSFLDIGTRETVNQNGWEYKNILTVESDCLDSSLSDFPLLVRLYSSDFNYSLADINGADIRFNKSGVELDYEIEEWNTEGTSFLWVRVPSILSHSDTTLEMFYGNPNATDSQNPDGVWGGYGMVHHLEESSSTAIDSSLNGNHGTYTGSNQGINGVIDGGYGFLQGESMEVSHSLSIDPGSGEFSISLWADLPSSNNGTIIKKWYETYGIGYKLFINEENELEFLIDDNDDNATKNSLLDIVDEAESLYLSNERISAHNRLLELRARLNPDSDESVVEPGVETGGILYKIDRILDQLRPKIRVIARDQRGITVSAYAELTTSTEDVYGPKINNADVQPLQCEQDEIVTLEAQADDRWYGNSSIAAVEYLISSTMPVGQNGMGINMTSIDGSFDESIEDVIANFSSNDLTPGDNYIWIHSKDSEGNWGYFTMLHVELILNNVLHIQSVDITGYQSGWFLKRYYAIAKVTVVDGQGTPVEDVTVEGAWSGDVSGTDTRITGPSGECSFTSSSKYVWFGGNDYEFTFTANSASKLDYTWDGIVVTETLYYP